MPEADLESRIPGFMHEALKTMTEYLEKGKLSEALEVLTSVKATLMDPA